MVGTSDGGRRSRDLEPKDPQPPHAIVCPICGAHTTPDYRFLGIVEMTRHAPKVIAATCVACDGVMLWLGGTLAYPPSLSGPAASPDMPDLVRAEYDEARQVASCSPRAAAALLRLAIQKLVDELRQGDEGLSDKIGLMVAEGEIRPVVSNMLDAVRVTGNHAVHPGQIDLNDEPERVDMLFRLVNAIVEQTVTVDRLAMQAKSSLPEDELDRIERRQQRLQKQLDKRAGSDG